MQSDRFAFVILHYLDFEMTRKCVESILKIIAYDNYNIVIVDNASPNKSGEKLRLVYFDNKKIEVILHKTNDGFAKGNNIGYAYDKDILDADYIICINNDVLMNQEDLLQRIIGVTERTKCAVLGPDILSLNGQKQSPRRQSRLTEKDITKELIRKKITLQYFKWKKYLFPIPFVERSYQSTSEKRIVDRNVNGEKEDVVLLGACIIYCPRFVKNEKYAFSPKTFMYGEEDLLAWYCHRKSYKVLYSPDISIIHLGEVSTKMSTKSEVDKMIFLYKYVIEGLQLLKKEMKRGDAEKS